MRLFALTLVALLIIWTHGALTFSSFSGQFSSEMASSLQLSDLVTVANYYGCHRWNQDQCLQCSKGFYFNNKGVCCEVDPLCAQFNRAEGICQKCYQGYTVADGACVLSSQDVGCSRWNGDVCLQCSRRWYFNSENICIPVSDSCATWNSNGACLTCYGGHILFNGRCLSDNRVDPADSNPLCAIFEGNRCLRCANRAYFDGYGLCLPVSEQCQTFDPADGYCLSCYGGYILQDGKCIVSLVDRPSDPGCSLWNQGLTVCLQCSKRHYFDIFQRCQPVNDLCFGWNHMGDCTSCYNGYDLDNGNCVISDEKQTPSDIGCSTWDWVKQVCLKCSFKWVFNSNRVCVPVSDQCKSHNEIGSCLSCYEGYSLVNDQCIKSSLDMVTDEGCKVWDWKSHCCRQCARGWVINDMMICSRVSDLCQTYNEIGRCTNCYDGYDLIAGECVISEVDRVIDVGCATWDWKNKICLRCSTRYTFNSARQCVPVSDQCRTHNSQGACLTCYEGYQLQGNRCVQKQNEKAPDQGCGLWDWTRKICLQCSQRWVLSLQGICIPVSDQCKTYDASGRCTSCYSGYKLENGQCLQTIVGKVSDLGCAVWDWDAQRCMECSYKWVFNSQKVCVPVSDQCKTNNSVGRCTSCYKGYRLQGGQCFLGPVEQVSDVGCATWDWDNKVCLKCSNRYVFNSQRQCIPVSDDCKAYNQTGLCTSCYGGYILNQGRCQMGNSLCRTSDHYGACTACYQGYLLNQGNCVPLSKLANLALYYSMCCPQKLDELNKQVGSRPNQ